ncbi:MAG: lipopolysaccharide biosynthesis protein [Henriciella sp.]
MNQLARKTVNGAAINISVTVTKIVLQFVVVIPILARVLPPSDFGLVAMAMAFVTLFTMFNDLGISAALVRADKPSTAFWSSAFWTNLFIGSLLTLVSYFAAPYIAAFFEEPGVEPLMRALSWVLLMHCIFLVPMAWLQRNYRFSTIAIIDLSAVILSAIVAIATALNGFGVWALIWQQITMYSTKMLGGLLSHRAPLRFVYKAEEIIRVLPFSMGLTGTALVSFVNRNTDRILIGKFMGTDALGYYGRAYQIMLMPVQSLALGASFALYPAMSEIKHDQTQLGRVFLKALSILSALIFPMMTGMAIVAVPFVALMFGPKWDAVAPVLRLLAFVGIIQATIATSNVVWKAVGRSDVLLHWSLIRMVAFVGAFIIGINLGTLEALAGAYLAANAALFLPFQLGALKQLGLGLKDFWQALAPQILSTLIMSLVLISLQILVPNLATWASYSQLALLVPAGIIAYGLSMLIFFRPFVTGLISEARTLFLKRPKAPAG